MRDDVQEIGLIGWNKEGGKEGEKEGRMEGRKVEIKVEGRIIDKEEGKDILSK